MATFLHRSPPAGGRCWRPQEIADDYNRVFRQMGVGHMDVLDVRNRDQAHEPAPFKNSIICWGTATPSTLQRDKHTRRQKAPRGEPIQGEANLTAA